MIKNTLTLIFIIFGQLVYAQNTSIVNFTTKIDSIQKNKLQITACDSLSIPNTNINGVYTFYINGLPQELNFKNGNSLLDLVIEKSSFIYIKHENEKNISGKLYYLFKNNEIIKPIIIPQKYLIIIPIVIVVLVFAVKKLIYYALGLLVLLAISAHFKGLNISTYFETLFDYLKSFIK